MEISSPTSPPSNTTDHSNQTVETPPSSLKQVDDGKNPPIIKKKKKKKAFETCTTTTSSSSSSCKSLASANKTVRFSCKRRNSQVLLAPVRRPGGGRRVGDNQMEVVALLLGMSLAAIVAQVMDRKDAAGEKVSVDHLTKICASAVRESLTNIFSDRFDFFARNFEKSFGSTLSTLRLINEASNNREAYHVRQLDLENSASDLNLNNEIGCVSRYGIGDCRIETELPTSLVQNQHMAEDVDDSSPSFNQELALHGHISRRVFAPCTSNSVRSQLSTIEESVMEQARSNDLKTLEIGLTMRKMKLKEAQLAFSFDSNNLERSKLAMAISKASFKAEKFKTQLEDTRHDELLKKLIDCLVAGLFVMSASIIYGAYVFSYKRIIEAAASCNHVAEESKSWWMPRSFSYFNLGRHSLSCYVQLASRMLFGILIILAVAYLLIQRSAASRQTMPITFILLLLGAACGFVGKLCVDTLGGSGLWWLIYWEIMCLLHFFSNVCTSMLFCILHGPLTVSEGIKYNTVCPYWFRRTLFYGALLFVLPLCCGLLPFACPGEWIDHFLLLATNFLSITDD